MGKLKKYIVKRWKYVKRHGVSGCRTIVYRYHHVDRVTNDTADKEAEVLASLPAQVEEEQVRRARARARTRAERNSSSASDGRGESGDWEDEDLVMVIVNNGNKRHLEKVFLFEDGCEYEGSVTEILDGDELRDLEEMWEEMHRGDLERNEAVAEEMGC